MTDDNKPARADLAVLGGTIETARHAIGCRNTDEMRRAPQFMARNREIALLAYEALDNRAAEPAAPDVGAYVLATKYRDGDPCDQFSVGWVSGYCDLNDRTLVVDDKGTQFRANGFRRVECITAAEGRALVKLSDEIGDKPGQSLWWHLAQIRNRIAAEEAEAVSNPLQVCPIHGNQKGWLEIHHSETINRDSFGIITAQLVHLSRLECGCTIEVHEREVRNEEHPANVQLRRLMKERNA